MIPATTSFKQTDTIPGEEIEFSIGDARWVMRTQADLYSNRELAVVREYSTNAADANKEARSDQPVRVTLPSMMDPTFKVRDFGDGMSREVLTEVYTKFGSSTKRDSNEFNGMLGYGSKSAVAYTDTFTVTSIHNGIKNIAVITRKPDWSIVMKVVRTVKTDEPSGTEVMVPVHNWQEFNAKAHDFYKFWNPELITINGKPPVQNVGDKIIDGLFYSKEWRTSYVVMGNVAYRIANPEALFRNNRLSQFNFVAYVDNGDVEFTPSREDLKYTQKTKDTLQKIISDFEAKIVTKAKADIAASKDHAEAYAAWAKWTGALGRDLFDNLTFKGDKLVDKFTIHGERYNSNAYSYSVQSVREWAVSSMSHTLIITEFDPNLSSAHKRAAKDYAKLTNKHSTYYIFTASKAEDIECKWIARDRFVKWSDLKAALPKKPRKVNNNPAYNNGRVKGSWDYYTASGRQYEKAIPSKGNVYWMSVQEEKNFATIQGIKAADVDCTVLLVPANREAKFLRENPNIKKFTDVVKSKVVLKGETLLSDDAKFVMCLDYETRSWLDKIDPTRCNDPEIARMKRLIKSEHTLKAKYQENIVLASIAGMRDKLTEYRPVGYSITTKYKLLSPLSYYGSAGGDHLYIYMNAVHALEQEIKNV